MPSHTDHQATTLFLVRHGQSEWNRDGRFQGQGDSPLTALGHAQVCRVAQRLQSEPVAALYSSDLGRAWQTAEIIVQHNNGQFHILCAGDISHLEGLVEEPEFPPHESGGSK
jgi:broad specificity phosphatase PhoE